MHDVVLQSLGLVFLLGGIGIGYWWWIVPYGTTLSSEGRGLLLLLIVTLMGGLIGSPFWWLDEPRSFAWDMPPLVSRMLAAAGWAFAVVCFFALQRPGWRRIRLVLILLAIYLAPLTVAAVLWHRERFDLTAAITYAFFALVAMLLFATCRYLWKQPIILPETAADTVPSHPLVQLWLGSITCLTGLWGVGLLVTANGPWPWIWAWPADALSSRLIGVMLLALAAGSLYSRPYAGVARTMLYTLTIYGGGIALAGAWNLFVNKPLRMDYLGVFGGVALFSGLLLCLPSTSPPEASHAAKISTASRTPRRG